MALQAPEAVRSEVSLWDPPPGGLGFLCFETRAVGSATVSCIYCFSTSIDRRGHLHSWAPKQRAIYAFSSTCPLFRAPAVPRFYVKRNKEDMTRCIISHRLNSGTLVPYTVISHADGFLKGTARPVRHSWHSCSLFSPLSALAHENQLTWAPRDNIGWPMLFIVLKMLSGERFYLTALNSTQEEWV